MFVKKDTLTDKNILESFLFLENEKHLLDNLSSSDDIIKFIPYFLHYKRVDEFLREEFLLNLKDNNNIKDLDQSCFHNKEVLNLFKIVLLANKKVIFLDKDYDYSGFNVSSQHVHCVTQNEEYKDLFF